MNRHKKQLDRMENELQHDKKSHKNLMGALKNHFKGDERNEKRNIEEEENEKKGYKNRKMDKDSRKKMAIMLIKKKMA